jgi:hypothetical protein
LVLVPVDGGADEDSDEDPDEDDESEDEEEEEEEPDEAAAGVSTAGFSGFAAAAGLVPRLSFL